MLDLYTFKTPNGRKVPIMLAELEALGKPIEHRVVWVDFAKNEQKDPAFLKLNPNGKIPAMVVHDDGDLVVFESGAMLQYLAEKTGELLPRSGQPRADVLSWLFWQIGGPGPMFGQMVSFARQKPPNEGAHEKFASESKRLVSVLETQLGRSGDFVAGAYSIADIANYPWFAGVLEFAPDTLEGATKVRAWMDRMAERPAVKKGMAVGP